MTETAIRTTARNASLEDMFGVLKDMHGRRVDVVASAPAISARDGKIVVAQTEAQITADGVTLAAGTYVPTEQFDRGVAEKLGIPYPYLRRTREQRPDLWDANVNGWLHGAGDADPDPRNFLVRLLRGDDGTGVARAFLSDQYAVMDNFDWLVAIMQGVQGADADAQPIRCDLSDTRAYVKFASPQVATLAPQLLAGYRSPFDGPDGVQRAGGMKLSMAHGWTVPRALAAAAGEGRGYEPGTEPVVFAGFVATNSDTGGGAWNIAPEIEIQICGNGLTCSAQALRRVHLGSKMETGVIRWSADTSHKVLAAVTAQTRDAVQTFLSQEFLQGQVEAIEALAGAKVRKPQVTVRKVVQEAGFSKDVAEDVLTHFINSGQRTAAGVANAMTSVAQTVESADLAAGLEAGAVRAMELVAAAR